MNFYKRVSEPGVCGAAQGVSGYGLTKAAWDGGPEDRLIEWVDVIRGPRGDATLEFCGRDRAFVVGKPPFL